MGDKVFLKVLPWRKTLRFGQKGKLSPRFIGSYEILERIGHVAYQLALPPEFAKLHDVFHVLMLLARERKQLWNKQVQLVKVLWQHHGREETTWKPEATMRVQYPQLFDSAMNFEDEILFKGGGGGGGGGRVVTPQIIHRQFYNIFRV